MGAESAEPRTWSTELRAGRWAGAEARWFLSEALRDQDDRLDLSTARLLTSEIATNAARHGKEPIELIITLEDRRLRVAVFDGGSGFDPQQLDLSGRQTGRFGLRTVDEFSSEWGVNRRDDGTQVWFRI